MPEQEHTIHLHLYRLSGLKPEGGRDSVMTKGRNGFTMPGMGSRTTDYAGRRSWGTAHATQG